MKKIFLVLIIPILFTACGQRNSNKTNIEAAKFDSIQNPENYENADSKDFEKLGFDLMSIETLNQLKLGLGVAELTNIFGEPEYKSKNELWEADGEYHQTYKYSNLGIEIDLIGEKETDKKVDMITIVSPCDYKTNKGISIGSSYREVEQAYKDYIDLEFSDSTSLVAGSIYGGLLFSFQNGKVKSIFIGASAE